MYAARFFVSFVKGDYLDLGVFRSPHLGKLCYNELWANISALFRVCGV